QDVAQHRLARRGDGVVLLLARALLPVLELGRGPDPAVLHLVALGLQRRRAVLGRRRRKLVLGVEALTIGPAPLLVRVGLFAHRCSRLAFVWKARFSPAPRRSSRP